MIVLVGTSHIAQESEKKIDKAFERFFPTICCVELDSGRLKGLLSRKKSSLFSLSTMMRVGFAGYVFAVFASLIQSTLGKHINMQPGTDMLHAYKKAQENNIPLHVIDQPIHITLKRLSQAFSIREFCLLLKDSVFGISQKKSGLTTEEFVHLKKVGKIDLKKVPEQNLIDVVVKFMKHRYPRFYTVLLHERNIYMCQNLKNLQARHPEAIIVAVVGAAHKKDMLEILKNA